MSSSKPENSIDIETFNESIKFTPVQRDKSVVTSRLRRSSTQLSAQETEEKNLQSPADHDSESLPPDSLTSPSTDANMSTTEVPVGTFDTVDNEELSVEDLVIETMNENQPSSENDLFAQDTQQQQTKVQAQSDQIASDDAGEEDGTIVPIDPTVLSTLIPSAGSEESPVCFKVSHDEESDDVAETNVLSSKEGNEELDRETLTLSRGGG